MPPGSIVVIRTPLPRHSSRRAEKNCVSALFDALYRAKYGIGYTPEMLATVTISSSSARFSSANFVRETAAERKLCEGDRRLEVDAALKDELFLRVLFERLLDIRARHVAQAGDAVSIFLYIGKHRRAATLFGEVAGKGIG